MVLGGANLNHMVPERLFSRTGFTWLSQSLEVAGHLVDKKQLEI